ncbi:hypothetical protein Hanom_Chr07g00651161 [Helianthus anomalus]
MLSDPMIPPPSLTSVLVFGYFPYYPFSIGFIFPFTPFVNAFFSNTKIYYSQVIPLLWRILYILDKLSRTHSLDINVSELATVYELRTHGASLFTLQIKHGQTPHVLKTKQNDQGWKT